MTRPTTASVLPPEKPEMMPSTVPIVTAMNVADRAMVSEKVMPYQQPGQDVTAGAGLEAERVLQAHPAERAVRDATLRDVEVLLAVVERERVDHAELHQERGGESGQNVERDDHERDHRQLVLAEPPDGELASASRPATAWFPAESASELLSRLSTCDSCRDMVTSNSLGGIGRRAGIARTGCEPM